MWASGVSAYSDMEIGMGAWWDSIIWKTSTILILYCRISAGFLEKMVYISQYLFQRLCKREEYPETDHYEQYYYYRQ